MEILSPKIDVIFKLLFTANDSEDILTDFLASVLDIENEEISSIKILNSEVLPETVEQKIKAHWKSDGLFCFAVTDFAPRPQRGADCPSR